METRPVLGGALHGLLLETFLRGMETSDGGSNPALLCFTLKPSLEGWKLLRLLGHTLFDKCLETFLRGMETPNSG